MFLRLLSLALCAFTTCAALSPTAHAAPKKAQPVVAAVKGRVVTVRVPAGYSTVTLTQRTGNKLFPWKVLGTQTIGVTGGTLKFTLTSPVARRALFVQTTAPESKVTDANGRVRLFGADPMLTLSTGVDAGVVTLGSNTAIKTDTPTTSSLTSGTSRAVSESDIWQIDGGRLYFFNQYRGLQVFDISNPDDPALLGQLREPNQGEQMYRLSSNHLALLTRPNFYFGLSFVRPVISLVGSSPSQGSTAAGSLIIADVSAAQPREVARISFPGYLVESRLVGDVLYVVSNAYENSFTGLVVTSFDLSTPTAPRLAATLNLGSYGGVVSATDRYLFVVRYSSDWTRSDIDLIDISDPSGAMVRRGTIRTAGQVQDKFKLHLEGDRLTVVSAVPRQWNSDWTGWTQSTKTAIENFDLTDATKPTKLGQLEVGIGETVRATRFSGSRLYVVTFFTIDPLWVIDYAPATPKLLGELEIPGFSTYIEPLGDRLVSIGRLNSQTAVSLFDVADPAKPKSLAQIPLGETYSSSVANWDEKAFGVFPAQGLLAVPFSGYDASTGYADRIQLLDLGRDTLTLRGRIDHPLAARRSTIAQGRLLAISGSNLVTVDITNRDQPQVTADVEIAWRVDRVFLAGQHLVQIGGSLVWHSATAPSVSVSPAQAPDTILGEITLPNAPIRGATVRANRLYVAQQLSRGWTDFIFLPIVAGTATTTKPPLIVSVFDLSQLPKITLLGRVESDLDAGSSPLEAAWPAPGTLVWVAPQTRWSGGPIHFNDVLGGPVGRPLPVGALSARPLIYWGGRQAEHELFVYDVSNPASPKFASGLSIRSRASGDWSAPIAFGGKLYLSSLAYDETPESIASGNLRRNRHFLRTVDFLDPAKPEVSEEVNIAGRLLAVLHGGSTLLTHGCGFATDGTPLSKRSFHTSHLDGTTVTMVDQLELPETYAPFALDSGNVFLATGGKLQAWQIGSSEFFNLASEIASPAFPSLAAVNGLLIGFGDGWPRLYDVRVPSALVDFSTADTSELTGYDFSTAAGGATLGLWQPLGANGVGIATLPTSAR